MSILNDYGWENSCQDFYDKNAADGLSAGRILSIKGFKYYVIAEKGELETELSGKLLYGSTHEDLPKVGDWVLFMDYDPTGYIISVFPRRNELSRKHPGEKTERQILATNLDAAFIVQGLDHDFNLMRLERYLVQITSCGIRPVVLLNKVDLIENPEHYRNEVAKLSRNCAVHFCSTYKGVGLSEIVDLYMEKFKTYVLIGSSGVGKSSLLNSFMNQFVQQTSEMSNWSGKGRHTTTTRDLFQLPNGSLIIDTPGMREFGLTSEQGHDPVELFPFLKQTGVACRFSDCKHVSVSGCAVLEAVKSGTVDMDVYNSYLKLIKEQRRFEIKASDQKRLGKQFGKMTREANNYRKKYKF